MSDPLDVLRTLDGGVDPDPMFAADLRERLERALLLPSPTPTGAIMTNRMSLTPYLVVADARAEIAWLVEAFEAVPRGEPVLMEDARVGHVELLLGGELLMLAEEFPELGLVGPLARGGVSMSLHLEVPDVDRAVARAVSAGGQLERPVADSPHGRTGVVVDPAGHRWMVQAAQQPEPAAQQTPAGKHGDVGYQTLYAPDIERTKVFFGSVLGWTYTGGATQGGWEADGVVPMTGLAGGFGPEVQLCFQVDDVRSGISRVQTAGGTADEPQDKPYGLLAECADDQGMRFQLWQPR